MSYAEAFWSAVAVFATLVVVTVVIAGISLAYLQYVSEQDPETSQPHHLRPYALWLLPLPFHQLWLYQTDNPDDYFDSYPEDL